MSVKPICISHKMKDGRINGCGKLWKHLKLNTDVSAFGQCNREEGRDEMREGLKNDVRIFREGDTNESNINLHIFMYYLHFKHKKKSSTMYTYIIYEEFEDEHPI